MNFNSDNPYIDIEQKARAAGISINMLCAEAGLARSTFTRGKSKDHSPNWSTLQKLNEALSSIATVKKSPKPVAAPTKPTTKVKEKRT